MTQTIIYLSVTRGTDSLTLDGNLYLFKELLTVFDNATKDFLQVNPATVVHKNEKEEPDASR